MRKCVQTLDFYCKYRFRYYYEGMGFIFHLMLCIAYILFHLPLLFFLIPCIPGHCHRETPRHPDPSFSKVRRPRCTDRAFTSCITSSRTLNRSECRLIITIIQYISVEASICCACVDCIHSNVYHG